MGASCSRNGKSRAKRSVTVIGMPVAEGQDWETGVEQGPEALRQAGLVASIKDLGVNVTDVGDIRMGADEGYKAPANDEHFYTLDDIHNAVSIGHSLKRLFLEVKKNANEGSFILTLGGDHSVGSATILGLLSAHPNLGVVWVDAHGDCNTPESSESKNYHGMPAAHAMGWFTKKTPGFEWIDEPLHNHRLLENRLVYIGLRDLDTRERQMLRQSKVHVYTMRDVDRLGIAGVMKGAVSHLQSGPIHLTFDIDAIDPSFAPGTGTLARGGLNYRESMYICSSLADTGRLVGMDMVEVNPKLDSLFSPTTKQHIHGDDPRITTDLPTVRLAVELVTSALGKSII